MSTLPVITTQPLSVLVKEGEPVLLQVVASGPGTLSYQWYWRDQQSSNTSSSYSISFANTYNTPGEYYVVVSNEYGSVTSNIAKVIVISGAYATPFYTSIFPERILEVRDGSSASFSINVFGGSGETITYQWKKDGVNILGATTDTLSFPIVGVNDAGVYTFSAYSQYGNVENTGNARLTVLYKPIITYHPQNQMLRNTSSQVAFNVSADGTGELNYQWYKNGDIIPGATTSKHAMLPDASGFTHYAVGDYYVVVSNAYGSITSNTATFISISPLQGGGLFLEGSPATLSLNVYGAGSRTISYQWKKSDIDIQGATNSTYSIASVNSTHVGSYTVTVTTDIGSETSLSRDIHIGTVPVITAPLVSQVVTVRQIFLTSTVVATGNGLSYTWYKNNVLLPDQLMNSIGFTVRTVGGVLKIGFQPEDEGDYHVVVSNALGSVTSNVMRLELKKEGAPTIVSQPMSLTILDGSSASFSVLVNGTTPYTYQWHKNGSVISGATGATYTISTLALGDSGVYTVDVSNTYGSVTSSAATLSVGYAPSVSSSSESIYVCDGSSATLTLDVSGTSPFTYVWKNNGSVIIGATSASYALGTLTASADDGRIITVDISNNYGAITKTFTINVGFAPYLLAVPPSVVGIPGTTYNVTVDASGSGTLYYSFVREIPGSPTVPSYPTTSPSRFSYFFADTTATWYVIITSEYGSYTSPTWTNRAGTPPVITAQPQTLYAIDGSSANLSVSATTEEGHPITYQWKKDGSDISGAINSTYIIPAVSLSDAGSYTVSLTNTFGTTNSATATLNVGLLPVIVAQPNPLYIGNATEQHTLTLNVEVSGGTPPISYMWLKNGSPAVVLSQSYLNYYTINNLPIPGREPTFTLENIYGVINDTYTVSISNSYGTVVSNPAVVNLGYKPNFTSYGSTTLTVGVGFTITFNGYTNGGSIKWQRNGVDISGEAGNEYTTPRLTLADSGAVISVIVYNQFGSETRTFDPIVVDGSLPPYAPIIPAPVFLVDPTVSSGKIYISIQNNFLNSADIDKIIIYAVQYDPSIQSTPTDPYSLANIGDLQSTYKVAFLPLSNPYIIDGLIDGQSYRVFMKVVGTNPLTEPRYSLALYPIIPNMTVAEQETATAALQDFQRNTGPIVNHTISGATIHVSYKQQLYKLTALGFPDTTTISSIEILLTDASSGTLVKTSALPLSSLTYTSTNGTYYASGTLDISAEYDTAYTFAVKTTYADSIIYTTSVPYQARTEVNQVAIDAATIAENRAFLETLRDHPETLLRYYDDNAFGSSWLSAISNNLGIPTNSDYATVKTTFLTYMTTKRAWEYIERAFVNMLSSAVDVNDAAFTRILRPYVNGVLYAYEFSTTNPNNLYIHSGQFTNKTDIKFPSSIRLSAVPCTISLIDRAAFNPNSYVFIRTTVSSATRYETDETGNIILDPAIFPNAIDISNGQAPHLFMISNALLPKNYLYTPANGVLTVPSNVSVIPSNYFRWESFSSIVFPYTHTPIIYDVSVGSYAFPQYSQITIPTPYIMNATSTFAYTNTIEGQLVNFLTVGFTIDSSSTLVLNSWVDSIPANIFTYSNLSSLIINNRNLTLSSNTFPSGCSLTVLTPFLENARTTFSYNPSSSGSISDILPSSFTVDYVQLINDNYTKGNYVGDYPIQNNLSAPVLLRTATELPTGVLSRSNLTNFYIPNAQLFGSALMYMRQGCLPNGCTIHNIGCAGVKPLYRESFVYESSTPELTRIDDIYYINDTTPASVFSIAHDSFNKTTARIPMSMNHLDAIFNMQLYGSRTYRSEDTSPYLNIILPSRPDFTIANDLRSYTLQSNSTSSAYIEYYGVRYANIEDWTQYAKPRYFHVIGITSDISGDVYILRGTEILNNHFAAITSMNTLYLSQPIYETPTPLVMIPTDLRNGQRFWFGNVMWENYLSAEGNYPRVLSISRSNLYSPYGLLRFYDNMFVDISGSSSIISISEMAKHPYQPEVSHVRSFGARSLEGLSSLTTLPFVVANAGAAAFKGCRSLPEISFASNISMIGESAFEGCSSISSLHIATSETLTIGANAFKDCSGITSIYISAPAISIHSTAFSGCTDVSSLTISVPNMDSSSLFIIAFTNLRTLNMSTISSNIFSAISSFTGLLPQLRSLSITFTQGSDILYVPALTNSTTIETVSIIGNRVINMPPDAFSGCTGLTTLSITAKLNTFPTTMLSGCTSLKDIILTGNNIPCDSYFDELTALETVKLINFTHLPISNSSKWLFKWCEHLRDVEIGPALQSNFPVEGLVAASANLEKIVVQFDPTLPEYASMPMYFGNYTKLHTVDITGKVYISGNIWGNSSFSNLFQGCPALKHLRINGVCETPIANSSVEHPLLETLDITYGSRYTLNISDLTLSIPDFAFRNLTSLQSVIIRGKLAAIGTGAFYGCTNLTTINFSSLTSFNPTLGLKIHSFAFGKTGLTGTIVIPESVSYMGEGCFIGSFNISKLIYNCSVIAFKDPIEARETIAEPIPIDRNIELKLYGTEKYLTFGYQNFINSYKDSSGTIVNIPTNLYRISVNMIAHKERLKQYNLLISELKRIYNLLDNITSPSSAIIDAKSSLQSTIVKYSNIARVAAEASYKLNPVSYLPENYDTYVSLAGTTSSVRYIESIVVFIDSHLYDNNATIRNTAYDNLYNEVQADYNSIASLPENEAITSAKTILSDALTAIQYEKNTALLPTGTFHRLPTNYTDFVSLGSRQSRAVELNYVVSSIGSIFFQNDNIQYTGNYYKLPNENITLTINTKELQYMTPISNIQQINSTIIADISSENSLIILSDETTVDISGRIQINYTEAYGANYALIIYDLITNPLFKSTHSYPDYEFNGPTTDIKNLSYNTNSNIVINSKAVNIQYEAFICSEYINFTINAHCLKLHNGSFADTKYCKVYISTPNDIVAAKFVFQNAQYLTIDTNKEIINIANDPIFVDAGSTSFNNIESLIINHSPVKNLDDIVDVKCNVLVPDTTEGIGFNMYAITFTQKSTLKEYDIIIQPEDWFWCYKLDSVQEQNIGQDFSNNGHRYKYLPTSATPQYSAPGVYAGMHPEEYCGLEHTFAPDTFKFKGRTYTRTAASKHNGNVAINAYFTKVQKAKDDVQKQFNDSFFWVGILLGIVISLGVGAVVGLAVGATSAIVAFVASTAIELAITENVKYLGPIKIAQFSDDDSTRNVINSIFNSIIAFFRNGARMNVRRAARVAPAAVNNRAQTVLQGTLPRRTQAMMRNVNEVGVQMNVNPMFRMGQQTATPRIADTLDSLRIAVPLRISEGEVSVSITTSVRASQIQTEAAKMVQKSGPRVKVESISVQNVGGGTYNVGEVGNRHLQTAESILPSTRSSLSDGTSTARSSTVTRNPRQRRNATVAGQTFVDGSSPDTWDTFRDAINRLRNSLQKRPTSGSRSLFSFITEFNALITRFNNLLNSTSTIESAIYKYISEFIQEITTLTSNNNAIPNDVLDILDNINAYIGNYPNTFEQTTIIYNTIRDKYKLYDTPDSIRNIMYYMYLNTLPIMMVNDGMKTNTYNSIDYVDIRRNCENITTPPYLYVSDNIGNSYNSDALAFYIHYYIGSSTNSQPLECDKSVNGNNVLAMTKANPLMRTEAYSWMGTYPGPVRGADNPQRTRDGDNPILCVNSVGHSADVGGDQLYLGSRKAVYTMTSVDTPNYVYSGATNMIVKLRDMTSITPYAFASSSMGNSMGAVLPYMILNLQLPPTLQTIGDRAFYMADIDTCIIPDSCRTIGAESFANGQIKTVKIINYVAPAEPKSVKATLGPNTTIRCEGQNFILQDVPSVVYVDSSNNEHTQFNVQYLFVAVNRLIEYMDVNSTNIQLSQPNFAGENGARAYYASDISQIDVPLTDSATLSAVGSTVSHTQLTQITSRYPTTFGFYNFAPAKFIEEIPGYENNTSYYDSNTTGVIYDGISYYPRVYTVRKQLTDTWASVNVELKETSSIRFVAPHFALISTSRGIARGRTRELLDVSGIVIGDSAFAGNTSLVNVTIPDSVEVIGANAFANCIALTTVELPPTLTTIGDGAFAGATSLTSITIPPLVETIGAGAFEGATSLTEVVIPANVSVAPDAFTGATSLTSIVFPEGLSNDVDTSFLSNLGSNTTILVPPEKTAEMTLILNSINPNITLQTTTGEPIQAPCFPMGTRILTNNGFKEVEKLDSKVDKIITADGHVLSYKRYYSLLPRTNVETAPYRIPPHTFGQNMPAAPVCLSPLHAIQIKKDLWNIPKNLAKEYPSILQYDIGRAVLYFHIELPNYFRDNIIVEGGLVVESFGGARIANKDSIYTYDASRNGFTRRKEDTNITHVK